MLRSSCRTSAACRDPDARITVFHIGNPGDKEHWWDLCAGPHVESTGAIDPQAVELERVAGAYWRGDEKRAMLTRIYGTAWASEQQLAAYRHRQEEALKRDHRKLGQQLALFSIQVHRHPSSGPPACDGDVARHGLGRGPCMPHETESGVASSNRLGHLLASPMPGTAVTLRVLNVRTANGHLQTPRRSYHQGPAGMTSAAGIAGECGRRTCVLAAEGRDGAQPAGDVLEGHPPRPRL